MSDRQSEQLVRAIPTGAWEIAKIRGSPESVDWFPLIDPKLGVGPRLGICARGDWVAVGQSGLDRLCSRPSAAWLLVLEYSLEELRDVMARRCSSFSMPFQAHELLPYETILMEGLNYGNEVGALRAIQWLEENRSLLSTLLRDRLELICREKSFPQGVRHRAAKLAAPLRGIPH